MVEASTIQDDSEIKTGGQAPAILPIIYIGRPFKSNIFINRVAVDEHGIDPSSRQAKVSAGIRVQVFGQNLSSYDSVALRIGGNSYAPLNAEIYSGEIRFNVPNYDQNILSGGGTIILEFLSFVHPELSAKLNNYFLYKTRQQEEESAKSDNNKGTKAQANAEALNNEQPAGLAGGVVKAAGFSVAGQAAAEAFSSVSGAAAAASENDIDNDEDLSAETEETVSVPLSSTNEVSTGGQTISQSENISATSGESKISSSGSVQETDTGTVSSSTSGQASISQTVSGTAQTTGEVKTSGTVSGSASDQVSVSGTAQTTGTAAVNGTASQAVSGNIQTEAKTPAQGGAPAENAQVKVDAGVSQSAQGQNGTAAAGGNIASNPSAAQTKGGSAPASGNNSTGQASFNGNSPTAAQPGPAISNKNAAENSTAVPQNQTVSAPANQAFGEENQPNKEGSVDGAKSPAGAGAVQEQGQKSGQQQNNKAVAPAGEAEARGNLPEKTSGNVDGIKPSPPAGKDKLSKNDAALLAENLGVGGAGSQLGGALANNQENESKNKNTGQDGKKQSGAPAGGVDDTQVPPPLDQAAGMPNQAPENGEKDSQASKQEGKDQQDQAGQPSNDAPDQGKSAANNEAGASPSGDEPEQEDEANTENQAAGDDAEAGAQNQGVKSSENAEAEQLVNKAVDTYLKGVATAAWASALPTFGLTLLLGALGGDILWLLKDKVVDIAVKNNPLLAKFPNLDAKKLKIEFSTAIKANIVAMNAAVILIICAILTVCMAFLWAFCKSPITYPLRKIYGMDSVCSAVDQSAVGGALNSVSPGGFQASNNVPGSLANTDKWTAQINTYAQKYNIDACILRVVVQKESGGNDQAIGCDCAYNKNATCPDKRKTYSSDYQFNWAQCSYGIGITQWTIYPQGGTGYKAWQNSSVPSRSILNNWYGVSDLLDANTSLDLTAHQFSAWLAQSNGDVSAAFGLYVGSSSSQASFVADRMALYNLCKGSSQQFGGGTSGGAGATGSN